MRAGKINSIQRGETRRQFIKKTGLVTAAAAGAGLLPMRIYAAESKPVVSIILDKTDALTSQAPVKWAAEELRDALVARGIAAEIFSSFQEAPASREFILVAGRSVQMARSLLAAAEIKLSDNAEALALARGKVGKHSILLAAGSDARGMVFALLEIADRIKFADDAMDALRAVKPIAEQAANSIRGISRAFVSDFEDKSWFQDKSFWTDYLTMLATNRFNRFNLALGLGYDFARELRDTYFYFAYPFLLSVPHYDVRAVPLPDTERDLNLKLLRFISDESARRGLHFQLGIWTHAFKWTNSPDANYTIAGLTPETQAAYCRDALRALLTQCPNIAGVTLRTHGESGVPEGDTEIWKTIFDGVAQCGRKVEIDLHAKGIDSSIIDAALGTGMPVTVSPKFWAEHMGLPYTQGAIRPQELPRANHDAGFFSRSSGARSFLRYGYGDLLVENRRYKIVHRIWPGTQRLLLWGDPETAAGYGRVSNFCGSNGVEIFEPLFFKGRKGSGLPGGRDGYADDSLRPKNDFEKYDYTFRVWGRNLYNPDGDADGWQRATAQQFGKGAAPANFALSLASRILPLVTTAHCPSAANNNYWPEMYFNMPIVDATQKNPYSDTPSPKRLGAVSPLDPEFFLGIDEFADELLKSNASGKFSPAWVANQLEDNANAALGFLNDAESKARDAKIPEFRRLSVDVTIQAGLGNFFAAKFRAGVLFALYERSHQFAALEAALKSHRAARVAWAELSQSALNIYRDDITFGPEYFQRGHWLDRLRALDADIADMEKLLDEPPVANSDAPKVDAKQIEQAMRAVFEKNKSAEMPMVADFHLPPPPFQRGKPVPILAHALPQMAAAHLRYRRVNQAEAWQTLEMAREKNDLFVEIPAACADSPFPLQYYFQTRDNDGSVRLLPGLRPGWQGQPFFIVRQA